jgi:hypothetical protein
MTDEPIPSLAEAMAEIRRLRAYVLELETDVGMLRGTLGKPKEDAPAVITGNYPPSAPPHDE